MNLSIQEPKLPRSRDSRAASDRDHPPSSEEIAREINHLLSEDALERDGAAEALAHYGEAAARALVAQLFRKPDHPHALADLSEALSQFGKSARAALVEGLGRIPEPTRPRDIYLLDTLIELLEPLGERQIAPILLAQLEKLTRALERTTDPAQRERCLAAKLRVHHALVQLRERAGLPDLLSILGDGRKRVRAGVVELIARIGSKDALLPLARLHWLELHVSTSSAQLIREAIREISRRDHVTPEIALPGNVSVEDRLSLEPLLPRPRDLHA